MSTYQSTDGVFTTDGRTIRAVMGYNTRGGSQPNTPTWVQHNPVGTGWGWCSCRLIRATGTTWRVKIANGDEMEVPPRTVRMRIG
jgi:hypothetical protein